MTSEENVSQKRSEVTCKEAMSKILYSPLRMLFWKINEALKYLDDNIDSLYSVPHKQHIFLQNGRRFLHELFLIPRSMASGVLSLSYLLLFFSFQSAYTFYQIFCLPRNFYHVIFVYLIFPLGLLLNFSKCFDNYHYLIQVDVCINKSLFSLYFPKLRGYCILSIFGNILLEMLFSWVWNIPKSQYTYTCCIHCYQSNLIWRLYTKKLPNIV